MVLILTEVAQVVGCWFLLYAQYYQYHHSSGHSAFYGSIFTRHMFSPSVMYEVFLRYVLFWDLIQHALIIPYRCSGTGMLYREVGTVLPLCSA
jgi:hypothetical protein